MRLLLFSSRDMNLVDVIVILIALTYMDLYIFSPFGPICWFCKRVLTKSNGKTHDTPITPAIPPLIIFGSNLRRKRMKMNCLLAALTLLLISCILYTTIANTYANCFVSGLFTVDVAIVNVISGLCRK